MRQRPNLVVAAIALILAVLVASCSGSSTKTSNASTTTAGGGVDPNAPEVVAPGDIPDDQVFVLYTAAVDGFSVNVPEGWARSTADTTTTFTDHFNSVSTTMTNAPTAPTAASARTTEVVALRGGVPSFQLVKVETVRRAAGPAVLMTYRAGSTRDPVTGKRVALDVERYEFWRNGKQVTLTLSGARGSDNVDPWKTVTNSFAWTA